MTSSREAFDVDSNNPNLPIPNHVAITMDGNGRWASEKGLPRLAGHRAGTENVRRVIKALAIKGVRFVTIFAFSTENWGRPKDEVKGLFMILGEVIDKEAHELNKENVRILHLGLKNRLPGSIAKAISSAQTLTNKNNGLVLSVGFDYGGRAEIVDAFRRLTSEGISVDEISEAKLKANLYLPEVPDPDLIIRTGGEQRLSNFLIWQAAYSELYFTPTLWPDFGVNEVDEAIELYQKRQRRFGTLPRL